MAIKVTIPVVKRGVTRMEVSACVVEFSRVPGTDKRTAFESFVKLVRVAA